MTGKKLTRLELRQMIAQRQLQDYIDQCHANIAEFSGWGDGVIPDAAQKMLDDAKAALVLIGGTPQ